MKISPTKNSRYTVFLSRSYHLTAWPVFLEPASDLVERWTCKCEGLKQTSREILTITLTWQLGKKWKLEIPNQKMMKIRKSILVKIRPENSDKTSLDLCTQLAGSCVSGYVKNWCWCEWLAGQVSVSLAGWRSCLKLLLVELETRLSF